MFEDRENLYFKEIIIIYLLHHHKYYLIMIINNKYYLILILKLKIKQSFITILHFLLETSPASLLRNR